MSMAAKAQATAYSRIVKQLEGTLSRTLEGVLKAGELIHKARALNVSLEQLSTDIGVPVHTLKHWERTTLFWGSDRIPGCKFYPHYKNCTTEAEKAFLMEHGRDGCAQRMQEKKEAFWTGFTESFEGREAEANTPAAQARRAKRTMARGLTWVRDGVDGMLSAKKLTKSEKQHIIRLLDELCFDLRDRGIDVAVVTVAPAMRRAS